MGTWRERGRKRERIRLIRSHFTKIEILKILVKMGKKIRGKEMLPVYRGSGISGAGISGSDCIINIESIYIHEDDQYYYMFLALNSFPSFKFQANKEESITNSI